MGQQAPPAGCGSRPIESQHQLRLLPVSGDRPGTIRSAPRGFLYSLANFGTGLGSFVVSSYVGFFYITVVGLPPRWVGWGLFAFSWWNALNDPLVGWLSDRTRTRWGRRVPYIAFLALPLALSFMAIWMPSLVSGGRVGSFAFMMGAITLNDLLYSMVALNVAALLPEMFPNPADRAGVNGWRQIMGLLGMLVGAVLAPVLAARFGWSVAAISLGGMLAVALLVSLAGIREHKVYAQARQPTLLPAVFGALRHRAFAIFLCLSFLGRLALTTLNATIPFYASYVLGLGPKGASWLLGAALLSALFTMRVWARLLARWGARRTLLVSQVMVGLAIIPFLLLRSLPTAVAACVVVGGSLAGLLITPEVMLSDVIDADHARTGQRHEGIYFGLTNLVNRLPNVLQAAMIGEILALTGFSATQAVQPSSVALGLRALVGMIPALAMASALVMAWNYPLHGARLAGIRAEVTALRAVAERSEEMGVDDIPS